MAVFESVSKPHNHTSHDEEEEPTILRPLVIIREMRLPWKELAGYLPKRNKMVDTDVFCR